jgi:hypothetical protein
MKPILFIDYLTLIHSSQFYGGNSHQLVTEISKSLKKMAKDFDCPVICLAQLNRSVESRANKIGIYSLKINQKDFVFIFAASERDAIQFYLETFHQPPLNCHEYSLDFELSRGNGVISFREMRKEFMSFPAIAGGYRRG